MKRIRTLDALMAAAHEKRAVIARAQYIRPGNDTHWPEAIPQYRPMPAAFMIGMPGQTIWHLLRKGVYLYEKQQKGEKTP